MLDKRGLKAVEHYVSPKFAPIPEDMVKNAQYEVIIWTHGLTFYKLAAEYYGDPKMWWVLAHYNETPTEAFCQLGQRFLIPQSTALSFGALTNRPEYPGSISRGY